jgi:L-ascorbate metabolism protein UlaG (beta-lactamase superfamily)
MFFRALLGFVSLSFAIQTATAQAPVSQCLAIANNLGAKFHFASLKQTEVQVNYIGHSTFVIESAAGVRIATDYAGWANGIIPDIATMNHAHSSHYTSTPDPAIKYALKGWSEDGKAASHDLMERDVRVRNVTTDIRAGDQGREKDGNSIFIYEVAGLCIGHLGHLHHELTPSHIGAIGRLDVVMVPVDGGMTLPVENMMNVLKQLQARVILPMHARMIGSLERFTTTASKSFKIENLQENTLMVSTEMLPSEPTVYIMLAM